MYILLLNYKIECIIKDLSSFKTAETHLLHHFLFVLSFSLQIFFCDLWRRSRSKLLWRRGPAPAVLLTVVTVTMPARVAVITISAGKLDLRESRCDNYYLLLSLLYSGDLERRL